MAYVNIYFLREERAGFADGLDVGFVREKEGRSG